MRSIKFEFRIKYCPDVQENGFYLVLRPKSSDPIFGNSFSKEISCIKPIYCAITHGKTLHFMLYVLFLMAQMGLICRRRRDYELPRSGIFAKAISKADG